jgi:hypothetical protein
MIKRQLATLALAGVVSLAFGGSAVAGTSQAPCGPEAGSLLVYPYFDNTRGTATFLTVTNTNDDVLTGTVNVEFIYIDAHTCLEFNRTHRLTANDTLTVLTSVHNPNMHRGYVYAFAKSPVTGQAIAWDHLAGTNLILGISTIFDIEVNAIVFKAGEGLVQGTPTDLDADGIRDLDGAEYQASPDELLVPRFFGNALGIQTDLILIGLTGARFTTIVNFLVYNDNEEVFSTQYSFDCWDRVHLTDISGIFRRDFLLTTLHNPFEIQGTTLESGWYRMDGNLAFSTAAQVADPAFLALQLERINGLGVAALPFTKGSQTNGGLLSMHLFGNP